MAPQRMMKTVQAVSSTLADTFCIDPIVIAQTFMMKSRDDPGCSQRLVEANFVNKTGDNWDVKLFLNGEVGRDRDTMMEASLGTSDSFQSNHRQSHAPLSGHV